MSDEFKIDIKKNIVHILDTNINLPVLSNEEHPIDDDINEFIEKHIIKILKDDNLKTACFISGNNRVREICENLLNESEMFSNYTAEIANILFDIMQKNVDIPSADLIFCLFELDNVMHLAVLKLNYKSSFIHYVQTFENGSINSIVKQKTALPGENQKVDECAIINLNDFSIKLIEKKYEINGEKMLYFSTMFLKCAGDISNREKIKIFKKATESFNKKYHDEDFAKSAEIRAAVNESIDEREEIDIVHVAENVFKTNPDMQHTYIEHIEKAGLREKTITVSEQVAEKTFRRQKIKTDTGIEINLPVEYYKDNQKVEFINNIDGTISILLKNISKIENA